MGSCRHVMKNGEIWNMFQGLDPVKENLECSRYECPQRKIPAAATRPSCRSCPTLPVKTPWCLPDGVILGWKVLRAGVKPFMLAPQLHCQFALSPSPSVSLIFLRLSLLSTIARAADSRCDLVEEYEHSCLPRLMRLVAQRIRVSWPPLPDDPKTQRLARHKANCSTIATSHCEIAISDPWLRGYMAVSAIVTVSKSLSRSKH